MYLPGFKKNSKDEQDAEGVIRDEAQLEEIKVKTQLFRKKIADDLIGEYTHWEIFIDIKQYYLGRVFIWAKRDEAYDNFDLTLEEWKELHQIKIDLKAMYDASYQPDKLNLAFLGNDVEHCHCHVVPRYKSPRVIQGITFKDENYGHNYSRDNTKKFKITTELHQELKDTLRTALIEVRDKQTHKPGK